MNAVLIEGRSLRWGEAPDPRPGPGEVLLGVRYTACNRADLSQRAGTYPPPPGASEILGLEASGEILEVGPGVSGWAPRDRACALLAGGGYAERVVVPAGQVMPVPRGFTLAEAAALPEAFATAWLNLVDEGGLRAGDALLVHAGASGVGTAAIQLGRALGARVFTTAGSAEKLAFCQSLGAVDGAIREGFRHRAKAWTDDRGFDVILDPVGAGYLDDHQKILAVGGRLIVIGLLGGRTAELDLARLLMKRQRVIGSTLRSRSIEEKARLCADLVAKVWPWLEDGTLRPVIDAELPITEVEAAHTRMAGNGTVGKIVLRVG